MRGKKSSEAAVGAHGDHHPSGSRATQSKLSKQFAFAKLIGRMYLNNGDVHDFEFPIRKDRVALGRTGDISRPTTPGITSVDLGVGDSNKLSREHAAITWDPDRSKFILTCSGKNGMTITRGSVTRVIGPKSPPEEMGHYTLVQLGDTLIVFLLPDRAAGSRLRPGADPARSDYLASDLGYDGEQRRPGSKRKGARSSNPQFIPSYSQPSWIKAEHSAMRGAMMKFGYGRWDEVKAYQGGRLRDRPTAELICVARRLVTRCLTLVTTQVERRVLESIVRLDLPQHKSQEERDTILEDEIRDATSDVIPEDRRKLVRWARKIRMLRRLMDVMNHSSLDRLKAGELKIHTPVPASWWQPEDDWSLLVGTYRHGYGNMDAILKDPDLSFASKCVQSPMSKRVKGTSSQPKDGNENADDDDEEDDEDEEEEDNKSRGSGREDDTDKQRMDVDTNGVARVAGERRVKTESTDVVAEKTSAYSSGTGQDKRTPPLAKREGKLVKGENKESGVEGRQDSKTMGDQLRFPPSENLIRRIKSVIHACTKEVDRDFRAESRVREAAEKEKQRQVAKQEAQALKAERELAKHREREERRIAKSQPFSKKDAQEFEKALLAIGVDHNDNLARDWEWFIQKAPALKHKYAETLEEAYQDLLSDAHRAIENREKRSVAADEWDENMSDQSDDGIKRELDVGKSENENAQEGQPKSVFNLTADRAEKLLERLEFFRTLRMDVLPHPSLPQILRGSRKPKELPVWWRSVHDRALLWGVDRHGVNDWESVATDPELGFPQSMRNYQKKHPPVGGVPDKRTSFPKTNACLRRAKNLLNYFRLRVNDFNGAQGPASGGKGLTPEPHRESEVDRKRPLSTEAPPAGDSKPQTKRPRAEHAENSPSERETRTRKDALLEKILVGGVAPTPFRPNKELEVVSIGQVRTGRSFYSERVVYPPGYVARRTMNGQKYLCEITVDEEDPSRPVFLVQGPSREARASDPTAAWLHVLNDSNGVNEPIYGVCGEERFGLFDPIVVAAIQTMPEVRQCVGFFMRDFSTSGGGAVCGAPVSGPGPG